MDDVRTTLSMLVCCCSLSLFSSPFMKAQAQQQPAPSSLPPHAIAEASQTSQVTGISELVLKLAQVDQQNPCGALPTMEELTLRQELLDLVLASTLDVDGVIAEISAERAKLSDLETSLKSRRDRTVARLNGAALLVGAGVGAGVNATQFSTLSSRTQNTGDAVGIASGIASVILSTAAVRKQSGPKGNVGDLPNMLAPLFDRQALLNSYYPPAVRRFLELRASGDSEDGPTRLGKLRAAWIEEGRFGQATDAKTQHKIEVLTTSQSGNVRISIDEIDDRIAMLNDVAGQVALMKRDFAVLMHAPKRCPSSTQESTPRN